MAFAANLPEAIGLTYSQVSIASFNTTSLATAFGGFVSDCNPIFSDDLYYDRVAGNWLTPMSSLSATLQQSPFPSAAPARNLLASAAEYVFRFLNGVFVLILAGRITPAQAGAVLAAWNARFGT